MSEHNGQQKLVDDYSTLSSADLLKILEGHLGDTPEAIERRGDAEAAKIAGAEMLDDIERTYLVDKRGEHETHAGKPKSYTIKGKDEVVELIYKVALEGVRQELGDNAVEVYKENPEKLIDYLRGKNIDYFDLKRKMTNHKGTLRNLEDWQRAKEQLIHVDDIAEREHVQQVLASDPDHYEAVVDKANQYLGEKGAQLRKGVSAGRALGHVAAGLARRVNNEYLKTNQEDLKHHKHAD